MGKKLTTEEFIERARKVHGDRYDYSDTSYVNASTKLDIRCSKHGVWSQLPGNHFAGKGCRACAGFTRLSTEEFVRRSLEMHGTKYDYSKSEYVNQKTRVRIICPIHGEFLQLPTEHYYAGSGCNRCASEERGLNRRLTTEEFIERAKMVHGDQYDYSQAKYQHNHINLTIICRKHGPFQQVPKNHIRGRGCPLCGGGQQLTTAQFVESAKEIHSERYDYGLVEYVSTKENVSIICSEHGVFLQRPADHLSGHGCQRCGRILQAQNKRLTTEEFIEKAEAVHGDRFDYSLAEYVDYETNITIVCPDHGCFPQSPNIHLSGRGCAECERDKKSKAFIQEAKEIHGDSYDYSLVAYVNQDTIVTIICPDHGPFLKSPGNHIRLKSGCAECSGYAPLTTEKFIKKAKVAHGDRYDYSQVRCEGNKADVTIVCPEHGPFRQMASNHYSGKGCPDCGGSKPHTTESFIEAAQAIHGDRYDYSQVEYVMNKSAVTIICRVHGPFSQGAKVHYTGSGCPDCVEAGFNPSEPALLYYLAITTDDGDTRYKIGVTNRTVEERFVKKTDLDRIRIVETWRFASGRVAREREVEILYQFAGERYYGPDILVGGGNTELFTYDVLGLDRRDDEHGQPIVDADAKLTSRQFQSDFDF
ncbi:MAG: hypothetical protein ACU0DI_13715 [Paracoccaceae bacterium]